MGTAVEGIKNWLKQHGYLLPYVSVMLTGFFIGRLTTPEEVRIETVEVESVQAQQTIAALQSELEAKRGMLKLEERTFTKPDGSKATFTRLTNKTSSVRTGDKTSSLTSQVKGERLQVSKSETTSRPSWKLTPMAGYNVPAQSFLYGGMVERRILGPVSLGVWGLSNGTVGVAASVEF